jgi:hypothetical protein
MAENTFAGARDEEEHTKKVINDDIRGSRGLDFVKSSNDLSR